MILGVDPGIARLGWGILEYENNQFKILGCGCIETSKKLSSPKRLLAISQNLEKIIQKYQPKILAIEELFFNQNLKTAIAVAESRGVILLVAAKHQLEIREFKPAEVKQAVTGIGNAPKEQVQKMLQIMLNLKQIPKLDDTSDALACAIAGCGKKY